MAVAVVATEAEGLTFDDPVVRSSFDGDALAALVSTGAALLIVRLVLVAKGRRGRDMGGWSALAAGRGVTGEESGAVADLRETHRERCCG